jgi:hypothetical protein
LRPLDGALAAVHQCFDRLAILVGMVEAEDVSELVGEHPADLVDDTAADDANRPVVCVPADVGVDEHRRVEGAGEPVERRRGIVPPHSRQIGRAHV